MVAAVAVVHPAPSNGQWPNAASVRTRSENSLDIVGTGMISRLCVDVDELSTHHAMPAFCCILDSVTSLHDYSREFVYGRSALT